MSSIESRTCDCSCKRSETGDWVCVCSPPCAAGKTVEWTCRCNCDGQICQAKFQLRCSHQDGSSCPPDCERNVFTCTCKCQSGECSFEISKCACCEVISCDCGDATGEGEVASVTAGSCCAKGKCC